MNECLSSHGCWFCAVLSPVCGHTALKATCLAVWDGYVCVLCCVQLQKRNSVCAALCARKKRLPLSCGLIFFSQMLCDSWLVLDRGFGTSAAYMRNTTTHAGWRSSTCMCDCVSLVLLCSATSNPWFYSCQECIVSTSQEMCCHGGRKETKKKRETIGEHDVRPPALARQPPPSPLPPFHLCLPACWLLEFAFKRVQTPKKESGGPMLPTSQ